MPNPLDLSGKQFGRLKVISLAEKRKHGKRQWLCDCDCGGEALVTASALRSGNTKSCGCLIREGVGGPFQARVVRQRFKDKESIFEGGQFWDATGKAAAYLGIDRHTLARKWRTKCPWRNGRGIEIRNLPGALGRTATYYSRRHLDQIKRAQGDRQPVPEFPGLVHIRDAAGELGCGERYLRRRMKAKRVKAVRKSAKSLDGRALPRSYVPRAFVDQCKQEQAQHQLPTDKITIQEAAAVLRLSVNGVHTLIGRGILARSGHTKMLCGGHVRRVLALRRTDVENYRDERAGRSSLATEGTSLERAKAVLRAILADGERHLRNEVARQAAKRGVSYALLQLAKRELGVITERPGRGRWCWRLPAVAPGGSAGTTDFASIENGPPADNRQLKRGRGRPKGRTDVQARERRKQIKADYQSRRFKSIADLAKHHGVSRSYASKIAHGRR